MLKTLMICLTLILAVVTVCQQIKIQRLRKRNKELTESRREWFKEFLQTNKQLKLTQDICNVTFENVLHYKKELAAMKAEANLLRSMYNDKN